MLLRESRVAELDREQLAEFVYDAWLARAGKRAAKAWLAERGLPSPRAIISGLPLILLPAMERIVEQASRVLAPGGAFRQFSYLQSWPLPSAFRLRRCLRRHFSGFRHMGLVLRNFPPAFVLAAERAKQAERDLARQSRQVRRAEERKKKS